MITTETRREIVEHAIRWCGNILAEVLSNHGEHVSTDCRDKVRKAVLLISEAYICSQKPAICVDKRES